MITSQIEMKRKLRASIKETLKNLSKEQIVLQSKHVREQLIQLPAFQSARSVSIYLSMHGEVETQDIVHDILDSGKIVTVSLLDVHRICSITYHGIGKQCFVPKWTAKSMVFPTLFIHAISA